jgi:hypothetical protein
MSSFVHEVGHHVRYAQSDAFRSAWKDAWKDAIEQERACDAGEDALCQWDIVFVSEYAKTSVEEDFAESYQAYREGWFVGVWRQEMLQEVVWSVSE